jgi:hypothetical protein
MNNRMFGRAECLAVMKILHPIGTTWIPGLEDAMVE